MIGENQYYLQPGYIFVSTEPYTMTTVLGSCVSICIWDEKKSFGGMNHYIYSNPTEKDKRTAIYGSVAIPHLIKLMGEMGSSLEDLRVHLIGGAQNSQMTASRVGKENILIADKILKNYGLKILTRDIGGTVGRKVVFYNHKGKVLITNISNMRGSEKYGKN